MSTALEKMSAIGGFGYVNAGTGARTGLQVESLVVMSDAVFSAFAINGASVMTSKGLTGVSIKAGTYLPTDPTFKITAYTLASGSVIEYL
jgi:hypothetical protein